MSTVAEEFTHVVGVDTHAKTHTYAILASTTGHVTATGTFPASPAGISCALAWASRRTTGKSLFFSVEGASSYGADLTRALTAARLPVCDVRPTRRQFRVGRGKSDEVYAVAGGSCDPGHRFQCPDPTEG